MTKLLGRRRLQEGHRSTRGAWEIGKPTIKKLIVMIGLGLAAFAALAFTDFGLSGGALAGAFTMLAVVHEDGRCARRRRSTES